MTEFIDINDDGDNFILRIKNAEDAKRYVNDLVATSIPDEIIEYAKIYFGQRSRMPLVRHDSTASTSRRYRGGDDPDSNTNTESEDEVPDDLRLYKILEAFDTIHDVCQLHELDNRWTYGIPPEEVTRALGVSYPQELTPDILRDQNKMLAFWCHNPHFTFGADTAENPLFDCGIDRFDRTRYKSVQAYANNINSTYGRNTYLCVLEEPNLGKKISAKQTLALIAAIKHAFGAACKFQLDSYHKIVKLFTAVKLLDEAFFERFTDGSISVYAYKKMFALLVEEGVPSRSGVNSWKPYMTDAKLFDGTEHQPGIEFDHRPTGDVFREEAKVNVRLCGIDTNYNVCFAYDKEKPTRVSMNVAEKTHTTAVLFSKFLTGQHDKHELLRAMATKRAGDWGQVEHCKKYDKVFVTFDRFAALYAYYRKVKFVFVREIVTAQKYDWAQFAFVLGRSA